jgi:hypothetical protein
MYFKILSADIYEIFNTKSNNQNIFKKNHNCIQKINIKDITKSLMQKR